MTTLTIQQRPRVLFVDRNGWGADPELQRLGYMVTRDGSLVADKKTKWLHHHDVIVLPNDPTPNVYENLVECFLRGRRLQTIRPDLVPESLRGQTSDVPYNEMLFPMLDGGLVILEGRGYDRTGAHTRGHNTEGHGTSWAGNHQKYALAMSPWVEPFNVYATWRKAHGLPNLETQELHLNYSATACPGTNLVRVAPRFTYREEPYMDELEELKARFDSHNLWEHIVRPAVVGKFFQAIAAATDPRSPRLTAEDVAQLKHFIDKLQG